MKKVSQRATRVGDQIQKELADLLRNEVKDPRVGPVTVTHVDVTSDLSHATVHFTHLAGREKAAETLAALARTSGLPAQRAVAPARSLLGSAAALRVRRFDRVGHADLAADRRRDSSRQEAGIGTVTANPPRTRRPRRRVDGVLLLDKPSGPVLQRGAAARQAHVRRRKGRSHRDARPARVGAAPAVLRRGDQVRAIPARRHQTLYGHGALRRHDDDRRCGRAGPGNASGRPGALRRGSGAPRLHRPADAGATGVLRAQVRRTQSLRIRACGHRRPAAAARDRDPRPLAACVECAGRRSRRHVQQGDLYPRPGRGHRHGDWAAARISRDCGGRRPADSVSPMQSRWSDWKR